MMNISVVFRRVLPVCAGAVLCGLFMVLMSRCSGKPSGTARQTAVSALEFVERGKENVKILQISRPDSVRDYKYFSMEDSEAIMAVMEYVSDKTLDTYRATAGNGKFNPAMDELSSFSSEAAAAMQVMMMQLYAVTPPGKGVFSGWKVKIIYDRKGSDGKMSRMQAWFIMSPDGNSVLKSFILPYVSI